MTPQWHYLKYYVILLIHVHIANNITLMVKIKIMITDIQKPLCVCNCMTVMYNVLIIPEVCATIELYDVKGHINSCCW